MGLGLLQSCWKSGLVNQNESSNSSSSSQWLWLHADSWTRVFIYRLCTVTSCSLCVDFFLVLWVRWLPWLHIKMVWSHFLSQLWTNCACLVLSELDMWRVWPVVTGMRKFDRGLSQLLHTELHWLDVPECVKYKLSVMAHRCLSGCAPQYLAMYCVPVSSIAARQHLRSAVRHQLAVPSHCLSMYGHRAFAIAGPTTWNSLSTHLRRVENGTAAFGRSLKTHLFSEY